MAKPTVALEAARYFAVIKVRKEGYLFVRNPIAVLLGSETILVGKPTLKIVN